MSKRKIYLEDIPLDEAWSRLIEAMTAGNLWRPLPGETVSLTEALGRVTAEPVWARLSAPHYHASAMDGYAVRARATNAATDTAPVQLALPDEAQYLDTGDPLPAWADAVIPIENIQVISNWELDSSITNYQLPITKIEIRASVPPWSHVRAMGEDMVATELDLP
ncbi:MAG: molybdopterin biosynthesis protein, partial [Chloroflexota bacterium]